MDLLDIFNDTREQSYDKYGQHTRRLVEQGTKVYNGELVLHQKAEATTAIEMVRGGTVSVGYGLTENSIVAILNFADALEPGGHVLRGSVAQEENICRCTNLYASLTSEKALTMYYAVNRAYQLTTPNVYTDSLIYSRNVAVFKDDATYENVPVKFLDVITCPAPSAYLDTDEALTIYGDRIEQIVLSAIFGGVDTIVLGAWGCGAFGQDRRLVAMSFANVLNRYGGFFEKIVFAIRPTPLGVDVGEESTFDVFKETLEDYYDGEVVERG